jgi:nicotinate-nucleotide adenylyltransferase
MDSHRWKGMRIGLLGGSFNPPHAGHLHISEAALKGLGLDYVWWLVTPQNPLKSDKPRSFDERMMLCRDLVNHPRMLISGLEAELGTVNSYDTVIALKHHFPDIEFVWITGMDNALGLHKWYRWQDLLGEIPFVHLTRYPVSSLVQNCPLRMYGRQRHKMISKAGKWPLEKNTSYWMLHKKMVNISSTEIRGKIV